MTHPVSEGMRPVPRGEKHCPLCGAMANPAVFIAHGRRFLDCAGCGLLHVHPEDRPTPEEERARYATHENDPGDPRYRVFLDRVARPLEARLRKGARGLDFGSGPGPTLSAMLTERGFPTRDYDPFFAPDDALLRAEWDFITCTETAEHFFHPGPEFERLAGMLAPGGWLALMTEPVPEDESTLSTWYYLRDPTHVAFYRERTLAWIARRHGWSMERIERRVTLFRDAGGAGGEAGERDGPRGG